MLKLSGKIIAKSTEIEKNTLLKIARNKKKPDVLKEGNAYIISNTENIPSGYSYYFSFSNENIKIETEGKHLVLDEAFSYLDENDIISISTNGNIRVLYRSKSHHNSILLTEQCDNYCLMCSQPPKRRNDEWLLHEAQDLIRLIPQNAPTLGITGGEPTVFGEGFLDLISLIKSRLPYTSLHILSNGRRFSDIIFTKKYSKIHHIDKMIGIPLYSSNPNEHDYIVQAHGAFDETVRGILNLKQFNQQVEIRIVIHKQSYKGLVELARYIIKNLLFVDHVALMGLEITGFTRANFNDLWIDPIEYKNNLSDAVFILNSAGIRTSVYNHPLCLVNNDIEPHYVKSISDWKNEFAEECTNCSRKNECGGFFSSGIKYGYSNSISPFPS